MKHLKTLSLLNNIFAALLGLAALCFFGASAYFMTASGGSQDTRLLSVGFFAGLGVVWICFAVFAWILADQVREAKWRIPQTVLAGLQVASFPLGTSYAIYALWVCWFNEPTKRAFEDSGAQPEPRV